MEEEKVRTRKRWVQEPKITVHLSNFFLIFISNWKCKLWSVSEEKIRLRINPSKNSGKPGSMSTYQGHFLLLRLV